MLENHNKQLLIMNIAAFLEQTAKKYPRHKAIIFDDTVLSYKSFNEQVNKYAGFFLDSIKIRTGDHVGILLDNCPEYLFSVYALWKIGAVVVPINRFLTQHEIEYIVNDSDMRFLISEETYSAHFKHLEQSCEKLDDIITLKSMQENAESFPCLFDSLDFPPQQPAVIIYTSGTTGKPKGAVLTHRNISSNASTCVNMIHIIKSDRLLLILPMFHSFTFTVCMVMPVVRGATIVALRSVKPFARVLKCILLQRVTIFIGIPKLYDILSEKKIPFFIKPFLRLRLFISGSAPLSVTSLERFKKNIGIILLEGYGLSEASPVVSLNPIDKEQKFGSIGLPIHDVEVKIVDDALNELPAGEVGELIVKGDNVMAGYYKKPEDTAATIKDGWLLTGDMATKDADGYIYIVDRKKDMVLIQGMNVYPREIEEVILTHKAVAETAVIGAKDKRQGEMLIAYITLKDGCVLTQQEILKYCKERLAIYKCPRKIVFLKELPRSSVGKILKRELRASV